MKNHIVYYYGIVEILHTNIATLLSLTLRVLSLRKVHAARGFNLASVIIFVHGKLANLVLLVFKFDS